MLSFFVKLNAFFSRLVVGPLEDKTASAAYHFLSVHVPCSQCEKLPVLHHSLRRSIVN